MPSDNERIERLEEHIQQIEDLLLDLAKAIYVYEVGGTELQAYFDKYYSKLGRPPRSFLS